MKELVSFPGGGPGSGSAQFRIGTRSVPYLADHAFQDLVVLPGSFYIEMALHLDRELGKGAAQRVRNATFSNPVILSADDTVVSVQVKDVGDARAEYSFYEGAQQVAKLEIDHRPVSALRAPDAAFSIAGFQARSAAVIDAARFYERFRANGNQYGPHFQAVASVWNAGDESLGKLRAAGPGADAHYTRTTLLDSMTQLVAAPAFEGGRTFVLRSIEEIELADGDLRGPLWAHVTKAGQVCLYDDAGRPRLAMSGVAVSFLERVEAEDTRPATRFVVAANFTAEPLEDALNFWADHFGTRLEVEFAPYNQIFQQLLDAGSAFRRNAGGTNVILLNLEEWAAAQPQAPITISKERAAQCFGARQRRLLPNGLEIVHLNPYETDYVYKEIFEDLAYLRHGIRLDDGATVVDIGANIGLFSLFVMSRCKNPRIFACEPAPLVFDLLKANCAAYGTNANALNVGVSDRRKTATFTFYEKSSVFSGFHSDENQDRDAIRAIVRNMLSKSVADDSIEEYVDQLTADRLSAKRQECQLVSLSDIIREHRIERIDLLKVDAEKSELDILQGIDEADWPKIRQIVLEIHDPTRQAIERVETELRNRGYHCTVEQETLLERSGLFNLYATRERAEAAADRTRLAADTLQRNVRDFGVALRALMQSAPAPLVLCFCPRSPAAEADPRLKAALESAEAGLAAELAAIPKVHVIDSATPLRRYPVADYYDAHGHQAGHMPYTPEGYAALGSAVVRAVFNIKRRPFKVIALDCDNTLWAGVCGEDGPMGVRLEPGHLALQEFMLRQMRAGLLLCLCTKNNEQDVLEVFDRRTDMRLRREHLVAWRANWSSKSENIRALAQQLNLGVDSFIFIDDNPVECAEVRSRCPGVLTLQLPRKPESFAAFLDHLWAFDHGALTEEDQNRTRMYQENARRQEYQEQALSLKDFLAGLQLRIEAGEATADQVGRIAQLTQRTNQFNFTTLRRTEDEVKAFMARPDAKCLSVRVSDRFGDYGLVGVLMYEAAAERYKVDTFLLSCRVLGRGVEHALVSMLGQRAASEGKRWVEFPYRRTEKNQPALEFIRQIGSDAQTDNATSWVFAAPRLAAVQYDPARAAPAPEDEVSAQAAPRAASAFGIGQRAEVLQRIGEELCDIERLGKAIEVHRMREQPGADPAPLAGDGSLEAGLLQIWRKVLGRSRIGVDDNFFDVGGTSLRAVQLVAMIKRELQRPLSVVNVFECPTVKLLAAKLGGSGGEPTADAAVSDAVARGQQRRYQAVRRKAS